MRGEEGEGGRGRRAKGFVEGKLSFTEGPKGCIRRGEQFAEKRNQLRRGPEGCIRREELASQLKGEGGRGNTTPYTVDSYSESSSSKVQASKA